MHLVERQVGETQDLKMLGKVIRELCFHPTPRASFGTFFRADDITLLSLSGMQEGGHSTNS
jgi:hypothetical protein